MYNKRYKFRLYVINVVYWINHPFNTNQKSNNIECALSGVWDKLLILYFKLIFFFFQNKITNIQDMYNFYHYLNINVATNYRLYALKGRGTTFSFSVTNNFQTNVCPLYAFISILDAFLYLHTLSFYCSISYWNMHKMYIYTHNFISVQ